MPELRLALRLLRQQPVVTFTTLLALAIGIGMATTGFTLLDAVLHIRLPFANGDRFVLFNVDSEPEARRDGLDAERFRLFSEQAPGFAHLSAFRGTAVNLQLPSGEVVPVNGTTITGGSFSVLPYAPLVGRALHAGDSRPGAEAVVLLRESPLAPALLSRPAGDRIARDNLRRPPDHRRRHARHIRVPRFRRNLVAAGRSGAVGGADLGADLRSVERRRRAGSGQRAD